MTQDNKLENANITTDRPEFSVHSDLYMNFCRQERIRSLRETAFCPAGSHTLFLLCSASGVVRLGRQQYDLAADTVLCIPSSHVGNLIFRCSPDADITLLNFSGTMAEEYLTRAGFHAASAVRLGDSLEDVRSLIQKLLDIHYITKANELLRTSLLYQLFSVLTACQMRRSQEGQLIGTSNEEDYLYFFLDYIRKHVDTVSIQDLAKASGLSRTYVFRLFRKRYSMSPSDFILRYRMTLAAHKIQGGSESLDAIATEVGYQTYAGFSTAFQKYFHILPTEASRHKDMP
jgi:AraC-like DNA-binding protein